MISHHHIDSVLLLIVGTIIGFEVNDTLDVIRNVLAIISFMGIIIINWDKVITQIKKWIK